MYKQYTHYVQRYAHFVQQYMHFIQRYIVTSDQVDGIEASIILTSITDVYMLRFTMLVVLCVMVVSRGYGQEAVPGTSPWTPNQPVVLTKVSIQVPSKYQAIDIHPVNHAINVPPGWRANIFYAGTALNKPRFMAWGPDSVLYLANMDKGNILAMPDLDRDGVADTAIVAASGFNTGHDVRFWGDTMYVAQTAGIVKLWRSSNSGYVFDQRTVVVNKTLQPNQLGGNHATRTLVIDSVNRKFYLSVGSRGNADREMTPGEERALIEEYNLDGTGRRIYASGIRNAVGMTLHPRTHRLWANNNGSDKQGHDIPGEWIDLVRDGGFYGYPFAYHFRRYFDFTQEEYRDLLPITATDSALVNNNMVAPSALIIAHSAPMAMEFSHERMSPEYRNGAFVALRGSWNRFPVTGAKLVFLSFDNDADTVANSVQDVCTGFLTDSTTADSRWARPVGLALAADGSIFLTSDDLREFILKLTPPTVSDVDDETREISKEPQGGYVGITPNPTSDQCTVSWTDSGQRTITVFDVTGVQKLSMVATNGSVVINTAGLASGIYSVRVENDQVASQHLLVISR